MSTEETFVIVGAGLTGANAAQTLREEGFTGRLILLGDDTERPYERPPLSKGYLLGDVERAAIYVHDEEWYENHSVELRLGTRVTSLDRPAHHIELADGERIGYTKLLLATGSSPRRMRVPGNELPRVHYLRRVEHCDRLREALSAGGRVVIAGAGWIGLEVAAAARAQGCAVTVVEPAPTPLHVPLGPEMGGYFAELHRDHGVEFRLGTGVAGFQGNGSVSEVATTDGSILPADTVIIGVGARPNTELAERAGLTIDDGIVVDATLRTDDPDIYAAGDVATVPSTHYGRRIRVEHWANAIGGGQAAAKAMLGMDMTYDELPYFFSDQYDIGMEFSGWFPLGGYDEVITRGDVTGHSFHAFWLAGKHVVAGMHVNRWNDGIGEVQDLIRSRQPIEVDLLADSSVPITALLDD